MESLCMENTGAALQGGHMDEDNVVWDDFCRRLKLRLSVKRQSSNDALSALKEENAHHPLSADEAFAPAFQAEFNKQYGITSSDEDDEG